MTPVANIRQVLFPATRGPMPSVAFPGVPLFPLSALFHLCSLRLNRPCSQTAMWVLVFCQILRQHGHIHFFLQMFTCH